MTKHLNTPETCHMCLVVSCVWGVVSKGGGKGWRWWGGEGVAVGVWGGVSVTGCVVKGGEGGSCVTESVGRHLVLSCLVFSRLVLSCLVLSCLVLACLVVSCLVWSCRVFSCLVVSCVVLSCFVLSCFALTIDTTSLSAIVILFALCYFFYFTFSFGYCPLLFSFSSL